MRPAVRFCKRSFSVFHIMTLFTLVAAEALGAVYVDGDVGTSGDGSSWAQAKKTISEALATAGPGSEIWVAVGTYSESIELTTGVLVYGGFGGTETALSQRNVTDHLTTIDGSTADGGGPADHVVVMEGVTGTRLDGFTITGGNADGADPDYCGGGIHCVDCGDTNVISSCTITGNNANVRGSAVQLIRSSPSILDCEIRGNLKGGLFCDEDSMPLVEDCIFQSNAGDYRAYAVDSEYSSPTISRCRILQNEGGLSLYRSGVSIQDCTIAANRREGVDIDHSHGLIDNCMIAGNGSRVYLNDVTGPMQIRNCTVSGGSDGFYCRDGESILIENCIVTGNDGVGIMTDRVPAVILNCTIAGNREGVQYDREVVVILNSIFANNSDYGIWDDDEYESPIVQRCLFFNNAPADYLDYLDNYELEYTGANELNIRLPGASENREGDPNFLMGATGTWTEAPLYKASTHSTKFTDGAASFPDGGLIGQRVILDVTNGFEGYIVSNTTTTLEVAGDKDYYGNLGSTYKIADYHLADGSAALDRGDPALAPPADFEDDARPGADGLVDIGADEATAVFAPPADTADPISFVSPVTDLVTSPVFDLAYLATDAESGIQYVELYYRRNNGPWLKYGGTYASSPIPFDSSTTGGDGRYDFYTRATDNDGNIEPPPAEPDATVIVLTSFSGTRIHVDKDTAGTGAGNNWANAFHSIEAGLIASRLYSVPEIWVAEGHYPATATLHSNLSMYGGFAGTETALSQRNVWAHPTIIDASAQNNGRPANHAVIMDTIVNARLDGFVVTGGLSNGTWIGMGVWCHDVDDTCLVANCTIEGIYDGAAVGVSSASPVFHDCIIAGNDRAVYSEYSSDPLFVNCTIADHGTAVRTDETGEAQFVNCLFSGASTAVYSRWQGVSLDACLFHNVYSHYVMDGETYYNVNDVNMYTPGGGNNVEGDPLFLMGVGGIWTADPIYDPRRHRTLLTDVAGTFTAGALVGMFVDIESDYWGEPHGLITSNTATAIEVVGDLSQDTWQDESYRLVDYHLTSGSAALDRGNIAEATAVDLEGDARPGADALVDIGVDEADSAWIPPADTDPPVSHVDEDLPGLSTVAAFEVPYKASDAQTGVAYVELYYRRNQGPWTKHGGTWTESPIPFDSSLTGGDGRYDLYTIATDNSSNVESAPAEPDESILVLTGFTGDRLYVDIDATGANLGTDWANALFNIGEALDVAVDLGVTEVWVAGGVYEETLSMFDELKLYGGFAGTETDLLQRDYRANHTIVDVSRMTYIDEIVDMSNVSSTTLDGFVLPGGATRAIYCEYADAGNVIANCIMDGNTNGIHCSYGGSPTILNCIILGGGYQAAIQCEWYASPAVINCVLCGSGRGIETNYGSPTIINCTLSHQYYEGIYSYYATPYVFNTVFSYNGEYGYRDQSSTTQTLTNCLFFGNVGGDYFDSQTGVYTGAADINANVAGATDCLDGNPLFVEGPSGTWTAHNHDYSLKRTTLTDSSGSFVPGELVGKIVNPNTAYNNTYVVIDNTTNTIQIAGYFTSIRTGNAYQFFDYHLQSTSPCIDEGTSTGVPPFDLDGNNRPIDIPGLGADGTGAEFDVGAYEFQLGGGLLVSPGSGLIAIGSEGGPFYPSSKVYTLRNVADEAIDWTATKTETWFDVWPTSGTLAMDASIELTVALNSGADALAGGLHTDDVVITNITKGFVMTRTVELRADVDYFTEIFTEGDNDLDYQTLIFTPDGSNDFYRVCRVPANEFPTDPNGGTNITFGTSWYRYKHCGLQNGAQVSLYGVPSSSFQVGENGYIVFVGDSDAEESLADHFNRRRISALFDNLRLTAAGRISWKQLADRAVVTYENIEESYQGNSNNFQVELFFDGKITITHLHIDATDGLVGLSEGLGIPPDFLESDLSAYACPKGAMAFLSANYSIPDTAELELTDIDLRDLTSYDVTITATGGDSETLSMPATHAGVFEASIPITSGTVAAEDGTLQVFDGETLTATYTDADDGSGATTQVVATAIVDSGPPIVSNVSVINIGVNEATVTFDTHEPADVVVHYGTDPATLNDQRSGGPATAHAIALTGLLRNTQYYFDIEATDGLGHTSWNDNGGAHYTFTTLDQANLTVTHLQAPTEAWTQQPILVRWTVRNIGDVATSGVWQDSIYLSDDAVIGDDTLLDSLGRPTDLAPSAEYEREIELTVPNVTPSRYWIVVKADSANDIPESNEGDNARLEDSTTIRISPYPNLQVPSASLLVSDVTIGDSFRVDWTVMNAGSGATDAPFWKDRIYFSVDETLDSTDVALGEAGNVSYLNAGEGYSNSLVVAAAGVNPGDYYVLVKTDATVPDLVYEFIYEDDNVGSAGQIRVNLAPPPDLVVESVNAPSQAFSGQDMQVAYHVQNVGPGDVPPAGWYDDVLLSSDTLVGDDMRIGRYWHSGWGAVDYVVTPTISLPVDLYGQFYVLVVTDATNRVDEFAFEDNNSNYDPTSLTIHLTPPPDLEITAFEGPASVLAGHDFPVTYTVVNNGATPTPNEYWSDAVYLSVDGQLDLGSDLVLRYRTVQFPGGMDVDSSYTSQLSMAAPADAAGTYTLFLITDRNNQVFELDDENNITSQAIAIVSSPPDLVVTSIDGDTAVQAGGSLNLTWTVENQGTGATPGGSWADRVFISRNDIIGDGDDVPIGYFVHTGALDPGSAYSVSQTVAVPYAYLGPYRVFVVTDSGEDVYEGSGEGNNVSSLHVIDVTRATADLELTSASLQLDNGRVRFFWSVANSGVNRTNVNYWYDGIVLSGNDVFGDSDDFSLEAVYHSGALDPAATYEADRLVDIPPNLNGVYYTFISANTGRTVEEEGQFGNNHLAAGILDTTALRTQPDLALNLVDAPENAVSGQPFTVVWTVHNVGDPIPTEAPFPPEIRRDRWIDRVYLSRDQFLDPESDIYVGQAEIGLGALQDVSDPGGDYQRYVTTATLEIPVGLAGPYYVFVAIDRTDAIGEYSGEGNNVGYDPIAMITTLPPLVDLVVGTFTVPANATLGTPFGFEYTLDNGSDNDVAGSWVDQFYLSEDELYSVDDIRIGARSGYRTIPAQGSLTLPYNSALPSAQPREYFVILRTDAFNAIRESDESNNFGASLDKVRIDVPSLRTLHPSGLVEIDTELNDDEPETYCFRFEATAGQEYTFDAEWIATTVVRYSESTLYVAYDRLPTRDDNDFSRTPFLRSGPGGGVNTPLAFTAAEAGTYYVRLDVRETQPQLGLYQPFTERFDFTLSPPIALTGISVEIDALVFHEGTKSYFYMFDAEEGKSAALDANWLKAIVSFQLGTERDAVSAVYAAYDRVPGPFDNDFAEPGLLRSRSSLGPSSSRSLIIPRTKAGTYYVRVDVRHVAMSDYYNNGNRVSLNCRERFNLILSDLPFVLSEADPDTAGNVGLATFKLVATNFTPSSLVTIEQDGTVVREAVELNLSDQPDTAFATFDLTGLTPGDYELRVTDANGGSDALPVRVVQGVGPRIAATIEGPAFVREGRTYLFNVNYGNSGDTDGIAPLLIVENLDINRFGKTRQSVLGDMVPPGRQIQYLGISPDGPAGVLRPGGVNSIPVFFRTWPVEGQFRLYTISANDPRPLDFAEIEAQVRPDDVSDQEWNEVLPRLIERIGPTWGDYVRALAETAAELADLGFRTDSVDLLFESLFLSVRYGGTMSVQGVVGASPLGTPLAGAQVQAVGLSGERGEIAGTDSKGRYRLALAPSVYDIAAQAPGYARRNAKNVGVSANDSVTLSFELDPESAIIGSVNFSALGPDDTDLFVDARLEGSTDWLDVYSGTVDGAAYRIGNLPAGAYKLQFQREGYAPLRIPATVAPGETLDLGLTDMLAGATIQGAVVSEVSSFDPAVAAVALLEGQTVIARATANASGQYTLDGVPPGAFVLRVINAMGGVPVDVPISVTEGQTLTGVDVTVSAGGVITGMLRDATTLAPLEGFAVQAIGPDGAVYHALTEADGTYEIGGLTAGRYVVTVAVGGASATQVVDVTSGAVSAPPLALTINATLWGRLSLSDDSAVTRSLVQLLDGETVVAGSHARDDGTYEFLLQREGTYELRAFSVDATFAGRPSVVVTNGQTLQNDFVAGSAYFGVTVDLPQPTSDTARVILSQRVGADWQVVNIDTLAPGELSWFENLVGGEYRVHATVGDDLGAQSDFVLAGTEITSSVLTLERRLVVDGQVKDDSNQPIEGATVRLYSQTTPEEGAIAQSDEDGQYRATQVRPGLYDMVVYADGFVVYRQNAINLVDDMSINPTLSQTTTRIFGRIVDAANNPVPFGFVMVTDGDFELGGAQAASDGTFEIMSAQGVDLTVLVSAQGYRDASVADVNAGVGQPVDLGYISLEPVGVGLGHPFEIGAANDTVALASLVAGQSLPETSVPGWLRLLFTDIDRRTDEVTYDDIMPIGDCSGCVGEYGDLIFWVIEEGNRWRIVDEWQEAFDDQVVLFAAIRLTEPWIAAGYVAGLIVSAETLAAGTAAAAGAGAGYIFVHKLVQLASAAYALHSKLPGIVNAASEAEQDAKFNDVAGAVNDTRILLDEIIGFLQQLRSGAPANPSANYQGFGLAWSIVMGYQAAIDAAALTETRKAWTYLKEIKNHHLPLAINRYNDSVTKARQALAAYNACLADCPDLFEDDDDDPPDPPRPPGPDPDPYDPEPVASRDPNDIIGPAGYGVERWVRGGAVLPYRIRFENESDATAPAQRVVVTQQLDVDLDFRTFRVDDFGWGDIHVSLDADRGFYFGRVDLSASHGYVVDVVGTVDIVTGVITWVIQTIDPLTGDPPTDALLGFLPPNDGLGIGEGFVSYTVRPRSETPTGAVIDAAATIVFDTNEPINTPPIFNTVDAGPPESEVGHPTVEGPTSVMVRWAGNDDGGSALANYTIFVSHQGGPYTIWMDRTDLTAARFYGETGDTYAFYSVARDNVDNIEGAPAGPDATTRIGGNAAPSFTGAAITPDPALETDTLSILVTGWSDGDGDPEGYHYQWKKNGAPIPGASGATLTRDQFAPGDSITCVVTAWDGIDEGNSIETAAVVIQAAPPAIGVTPTSIVVQIDESDEASSAVLTVHNAGGGELEYSIAAMPGWLVVTPSTGSVTTIPAAHTVWIDPSGLSPADYAGTITVAAPSAANSPVSIPVSLRISNSPPSVAIVSIDPNPAQPPADTIAFEGDASDGAGAIVSMEWRSSLDGLLSENESFTMSSEELTVGDHTITLQAQDDEGSSASATMGLTVLNALPSADIVSISPNPATPGSTVTIELAGRDNDEGGSSLADGVFTFDGSPTSSVLPGSQSVVSPSSEGEYEIMYRVMDDESSWSTAATSTLRVMYPHIAAAPTSLTYTWVGAGMLTTAPLAIWNDGGFDALTYDVTATPTWLSCAPTTAGLLADPTTHTVTIDARGLATGDHAGTVTISSKGVSNSPLAVPVLVRIQPRQTVELTTRAEPPEGGRVEPMGTHTFDTGITVTVTALPNPGWFFELWSGDLTGTQNPAEITMDSDRDITGHFSKVPGPNLTGTIDEVGPRPIAGGHPISLTGEIVNAGTEPTTAPFWIEFYATSEQTGERRFLCDSFLVGVALDAGATIPLSAFASPVCYDTFSAGAYRIDMNIDAANAIDETVEGDNWVVGPSAVIEPDLPNLRAMDFDFTPDNVSPMGGDAITFSGRLLNSGTRATSGTFWVEFRATPGWQFDPNGPFLCDSLMVSMPLEAGAEFDLANISQRFTYALPTGVYTIGIVIDATNAVEEVYENDNTTWKSQKRLYVGPRPTPARRWPLYP